MFEILPSRACKLYRQVVEEFETGAILLFWGRSLFTLCRARGLRSGFFGKGILKSCG